MYNYRVILPNGKAVWLKHGTLEERKAEVNALLEKWSEYCNNGWLSNDYEDAWCPENKVKHFLDSLAYYLLSGFTDDVVTEYKDIMNGVREVPMSSCPPDIENGIYATGVKPSDDQSRESFSGLMSHLTEKAGRYTKAKPKKKAETRLDRYQKIVEVYGKGTWTRYLLDTDCVFEMNGHLYRIENEVYDENGQLAGYKYPQYMPVKSDLGELYEMDRILVYRTDELGLTLFFDMALRPVSRQDIVQLDK